MKRLSPDEYHEVAAKIRAMKDIYWDVFHDMTGRFPKNSRTIRKLLKLDDAITSLYYQAESEYFKDNPDDKEGF